MAGHVPASDERVHHVYRFWDAHGTLLYIGCTIDVAVRIREHATDKSWFPSVGRATFETFSGRGAAREAEASAIRREKPRWNVHKGTGWAIQRQGHWSHYCDAWSTVYDLVEAGLVPHPSSVAAHVLSLMEPHHPIEAAA